MVTQGADLSSPITYRAIVTTIGPLPATAIAAGCYDDGLTSVPMSLGKSKMNSASSLSSHVRRELSVVDLSLTHSNAPQRPAMLAGV